MSRLAGFNFVFQLRREKLLDLIQENVTLAGSSLATPFRLSLPGPLTPGRPPRRLNTLDLVVKALDLALEVGTNFCTLTLLLEAGVIRLPGAPEVTFSGGAQRRMDEGSHLRHPELPPGRLRRDARPGLQDDRAAV